MGPLPLTAAVIRQKALIVGHEILDQLFPRANKFRFPPAVFQAINPLAVYHAADIEIDAIFCFLQQGHVRGVSQAKQISAQLPDVLGTSLLEILNLPLEQSLYPFLGNRGEIESKRSYQRFRPFFVCHNVSSPLQRYRGPSPARRSQSCILLAEKPVNQSLSPSRV